MYSSFRDARLNDSPSKQLRTPKPFYGDPHPYPQNRQPTDEGLRIWRGMPGAPELPSPLANFGLAKGEAKQSTLTSPLGSVLRRLSDL